ncbi:MAG: CpaF family protein [Planctomycetes bacterium]|nr:CpaF family protein [Planctomycetota bacterium]
MGSFLDNPALAPIRDLMLDPEVSEIMINGPRQVYIERRGRMQPHPLKFADAEQLRRLIEILLRPTGRAVSSATPFADFRLPDGSRGNVVIPPLALDGPVVTIRKFTRHLATVTDLIEAGTICERMAVLLAAAVKGRANIIFSGAAGTGKTTTLGIFSRYIPADERIITIEDTAELQLQQDHVVRLECRRANLEGKGEVTLADLLKNSLRMRPTRIIVGEVRGEEAMDMLQAIATGHQGCLAVLHASSPVDAVSRLEMLALARGLMLPLWAIHKQIASAIDVIVQHEQLADGSRKITHVTEVAGVEDERVVLRDIFHYRRIGADSSGREIGEWKCTGVRPGFLEKCRKRGVTVADAVLAEGTA